MGNNGSKDKVAQFKDITDAINSAYNTNDLTALVNMLDDNHATEEVKSFVKQRHAAMLNFLGKADNIKDADFLHNLGSKVDEKINEILPDDRFSKSTSQSTSNIIKESVAKVQNILKSLYTKYRFFEFKYIEINIFMVILINRIVNLIEEQNSLITGYAAMQRAQETELKLFLQKLGNLDIDDTTTERIKSLSQGTQLQMTKTTNRISETVDITNKQTVDLLTLIKQMMEQDASVYDKFMPVLKGIERPKQ